MEDTLHLEFTDEGVCSTPWITQELNEIMEDLGPAPDEFMAGVNSNPYCG